MSRSELPMIKATSQNKLPLEVHRRNFGSRGERDKLITVTIEEGIDGDEQALRVEPEQQRGRLLLVERQAPGDGLGVIVGPTGQDATALVAQPRLIAA